MGVYTIADRIIVQRGCVDTLSSRMPSIAFVFGWSGGSQWQRSQNVSKTKSSQLDATTCVSIVSYSGLNCCDCLLQWKSIFVNWFFNLSAPVDHIAAMDWLAKKLQCQFFLIIDSIIFQGNIFWFFGVLTVCWKKRFEDIFSGFGDCDEFDI